MSRLHEFAVAVNETRASLVALALRQQVTPPSWLKRRTLRKYARRYGLATFVETGTLFGGTTAALLSVASTVHTIELSPQLADRARRRFAADKRVTVHEGDSAVVLQQLLPCFDKPCLFWLDGHWSDGITARGEADTPVRSELSSILDRGVRGDVILVDDARHFTGVGDYPTIESVLQMAAERGRSARVALDMIRIVPAGPPAIP